MELDERPFEQRSFEDCHHKFAMTQNDRLVRIEDYAKQHYWGSKRFEVRAAFVDAAGVRVGQLRWVEEDENLTPAFPNTPNWVDKVAALRARKQASGIEAHTGPAAAPPAPRRM